MLPERFIVSARDECAGKPADSRDLPARSGFSPFEQMPSRFPTKEDEKFDASPL
jgi:hypothetical protein